MEFFVGNWGCFCLELKEEGVWSCFWSLKIFPLQEATGKEVEGAGWVKAVAKGGGCATLKGLPLTLPVEALGEEVEPPELGENEDCGCCFCCNDEGEEEVQEGIFVGEESLCWCCWDCKCWKDVGGEQQLWLLGLAISCWKKLKL